MTVFSSVPLFRIMIPFLLGILAGIYLKLPAIPLFVFGLLFLLILFLNFYRSARSAAHRGFIVSTDVFLILLGITLVHLHNLSEQPLYYGNLVNTDTTLTCIASVSDVPVEKEKFVKCELKLLEVRSGGKFVPAKGTIFGYFRRPFALKPGQTILVKVKLLEVPAPGNPYEFDYKNYLYNRQIYHTAFIDPDSYAPLSAGSQLNPLWQLGLDCKAFVLNRLKGSGLTQMAYGICAALLTGYDDEIDKPVMEAFSHSGTLHVLSVSGLHTGLIYMALNLLFNLIDRQNRCKTLRLILITLILWFFALITGFSAPVLRAVIMFNLLGFGKIYFRARTSHQLNILVLSAFILLLYDPFYISDVGFLLSYFALFGLLYFQPRFSALWVPQTRLLVPIWQSVTASVAATLSTLPITLFYFKQFPLWFFICNMVVVPATFVLLMLALLIVCHLGIVSGIVNHSIAFLVEFINLFDSDSFGFVDNIHFNFTDAVFLSLLLIFVSLAIQYHSGQRLVVSAILLVTWQLVSLITSFRAKQESFLAIYHIKNKTAIAIKNKDSVTLSEITRASYNFSMKPHLITCNNPGISQKTFNLLQQDQETVLFLQVPGCWPAIDPGTVTTLVLCNNFRLKADDLAGFTRLRTLVMDASNNNYNTARAEELSRNFGISFYSTRHKGAYFLALQ